VPYTNLNVSSPVAFALQKIGLNSASAIVATGVIAGLTTVMLVLYYALTRIILAMSRDGLLPKQLNKINKSTKTPIRVILVCGFIMALIAGFVSLGTLAEIVNIGTLSAFIVVCCGVIALRHHGNKSKYVYKNKWHPLVPVMGIVTCTLLMTFLPLDTWIRFLSWMSIGIIFYFIYSYKHSKLN
jgi:APA family basic amino acid/polyamine antiporter